MSNNRKQLLDILEVLVELRRAGIPAPDYNLGSPFAQRAKPAEKPPHSVQLPTKFEKEARIVNIFIPLVIGGLTEEQFNKYWAEAVAMTTVKGRN